MHKKLKSTCAPAPNWRRERTRDTTLVRKGKRLSRALLHALSERCSTEGAANAAGVANQANVGRSATGGAFDLVPHCKLAKVCDPTLSRLDLVRSVAQHREHIRGALRTNGRILFSVRLHAELWNGHCRKRSNRIEKKLNFVCSITSRLTPIAIG